MYWTATAAVRGGDDRVPLYLRTYTETYSTTHLWFSSITCVPWTSWCRPKKIDGLLLFRAQDFFASIDTMAYCSIVLPIVRTAATTPMKRESGFLNTAPAQARPRRQAAGNPH